MNLMIVDDHEIVRDGLALLLEQSYCIDSVEFASNGYEAIELAEGFSADLILLDVSMPGGLDGFSVIEKIRSLLPEAKVVMFSMYDDIAYQKKAYRSGVNGYLVKNMKSNELIQSLDSILANKKVFSDAVIEEENVDEQHTLELPITKREKEVFTLTVLGYSLQEIADKMGITVKTVENHRQKIGFKLGTQRRFEWVEIARKYNLFAATG